VRQRDLLGNRQAEPRTMAAATLESLEYTLTIGWRHARLVVIDGHRGAGDRHDDSLG